MLKDIFKLPCNHHRYAQNLSCRLSVQINFWTLLLREYCFHYISLYWPLTCLEIVNNCQIGCKTYLLFASKRKEVTKKTLLILSFQNSRYYQEPPANICGLINDSIATYVFVFICSILLRLRFYLKVLRQTRWFSFFVSFLSILINPFRFESTHQLMVHIDFFFPCLLEDKTQRSQCDAIPFYRRIVWSF